MRDFLKGKSTLVELHPQTFFPNLASQLHCTDGKTGPSEAKCSLPCRRSVRGRMRFLLHNSSWPLRWHPARCQSHVVRGSPRSHAAAASCLCVEAFLASKGRCLGNKVLTFWLQEKVEQMYLPCSYAVFFFFNELKWKFTTFFMSLEIFGLYVKYIPNEDQLELKCYFLS